MKNWTYVTSETLPALKSKMIGKVITNVYYKDIVTIRRNLFEEPKKTGKEVFFDIEGLPYLKLVAGIEGNAIKFYYTDSNDSNNNDPNYKTTWSEDLFITDLNIRNAYSTYDGELQTFNISGTVNKLNDAIRDLYFVVGSPDENFFQALGPKYFRLFVSEGIE